MDREQLRRYRRVHRGRDAAVVHVSLSTSAAIVVVAPAIVDAGYCARDSRHRGGGIDDLLHNMGLEQQ